MMGASAKIHNSPIEDSFWIGEPTGPNLPVGQEILMDYENQSSHLVVTLKNLAHCADRLI
jgi:hypothetical protein